MGEVGFETGAEGEGAEWEGGVGEEEEEVRGGGGVVDWGGVSLRVLWMLGSEERDHYLRRWVGKGKRLKLRP